VDTPTYISLYTGGGGLDLGFKLAVPGARCVCYVERDAAACALLVDHMQAGQLDDAPLWSDSRTFDGKPWRGKVDWIIGGFPCQPWSIVGEQKGTEDERWLWPDIRRLVREIRPGGVFLENVSGLLRGGIEHVLGGLASLGYDAEWTSVRASQVGAIQRRSRVFILAHSRSVGMERLFKGERSGDIGRWRIQRPSGPRNLQQLSDAPFEPGNGWPQPLVRRDDDGFGTGMDRINRIRILGNGVVPQQAALAFAAMIGAIE